LDHVSEPNPDNPRRTRRSALAGAALLVTAIPILVALLLNGGARGVQANPTVAPLHLSPLASSPTPPLPDLLLPPGTGALVARVQHPTKIRSAPGGRVFATLPTHTGFGTPNTVWVAKRSGTWLGVVSPVAGNHRLGWIPASDAALSRVNWEIKVSLSARMVTVLHDGKAVEHYLIAIGAPTAPTPTGHFAVTDRLNTGDPTGPYGCCILALSALAPHHISDWDGGNRIAIHSTPETSSIGHDVSHGCMRLTLPEGQWLIDHIPLGTPTLISS
jgi:hypothetical protein